MIKNYFKIALRNLWHNKLISGINILGLAVGIACCLLITLYVFQETSYDHFHKKGDRIVRATTELNFSGTLTKVAVTGTKALPEFKRTFPEVESGVRIYPTPTIVKFGDKLFQEKGFVYADATFFDIFSFKLLKGNTATILKAPNQIVLTETSARKYFGKENPIGKSLQINNDKDYIVSGITEDCPANSQIKFDMIASWSSLTDPLYTHESWADASYYTYLLLKSPEMIKILEAKIPGYFKAQNKDYGVAGKNYLNIRIQPMEDVHLRSIVDGGMEPNGDIRYIYIFSIIAVLILIIACANYINLTTARASDRAKEVGLRKVIGASRWQLFFQFIGESLIMVLVALLISLSLAYLFLPEFNFIADKQLSMSALVTAAPLITVFALLILIGFLGSVYPALVLSGFNPLKTLKGITGVASSGIGLRKSLIVVQFFISTCLILGTLVIHNQLEFIRNKKLGYDNTRVLVLRSDEALRKKINTLKSVLMARPSVLGVTTCNQSPTFIQGKFNMVLDGKETIITGVRTDKDFVRVMGLHIVSGADFTRPEEEAAFAVTDTIQRPVIVNEAAVRSFGWKNQEAIGKVIKFQGRNTIIKGVVNDFHFSSMHETISPFIIFMSNYTSKVMVKLSGQRLPEAMSFIQATWTKLAPEQPFEYEFLDAQFNKLYSAETRTGLISYSFALLAIGLACLGLLGLVTFSALQRTKEIGIRKVLGATVTNIAVLLSKDFLKLVGIATVLALPVAWWITNKWLEGFAYRITINWWMFMCAGLMAIVIAITTVGFQAVKAALMNPAKSLRSE
ncbi:MAG: transporter permease [Chitinophagaceae bacterium]|nr:transporter permease [Chitinophagaceae bacterium]